VSRPEGTLKGRARAARRLFTPTLGYNLSQSPANKWEAQTRAARRSAMSMTRMTTGPAAALAAAMLMTMLPGCGSDAAPPAELLSRRGYQLEPQAACKAAGRGDVEALRLLAQAGQTPLSLVVDGDRFCLESVLVGRTAKVDLAAVLDAVKPAKGEFNRVYASSTGMTARDVPQAETLARAAGHRAVDLYAGGAVVEATPLMWAVWSDDLDAVQALLAHGADPNLASTVPMRVNSAQQQALVRVTTSPLFEAHRLQRPQIAKLLAKHGAKPRIASEQPKV